MKILSCRGACLTALLVGLQWGNAQVRINEIMYHPASELNTEEYIELVNSGPTNVNLASWRFSKGVQFTFPGITISNGAYLVVAADVATFTNKYPGVRNVVGGWVGRLSNSRNVVNLDDAASNNVDSVEYADEGDWAVRQRASPDQSHRGWTWFAEADGFGKSLELISPDLANNHGQNWLSSLVTNGTPGAVNSVLQTNIAPLILNVQHLPAIPRSTDNVLVSAQLLDERTNNLTAKLVWKPDAGAAFTTNTMFDDGLHSDGVAGDGVFAAMIPPQANNAIVEFFIQAQDLEGHIRTWPAAAVETNGVSLGQAANLLYQVDDSAYPGAFPLYKLIMKETNRAELAQIGSASNGEQNTDAEMNGTFISVDGTGTDVRYTVGIRNRGHGSRNKKPNNYRVNFRSDDEWNGVTALNLNGQYPHSQLLGAVLSLKAGVGGADSRAVQVRVNNSNLGSNSAVMFGTCYAANEEVDSDWAEHWLPADSSGNIYRALRDIAPPDFTWRGTNYPAYTNTWFKQSNKSEDDWSDLLAMMRIMGTNDLFTADAVNGVIHAEQWMTYLAVMALFNNQETTINRGYNDDYFFYAGVNDRRFYLMYYDLDTCLGEGDTTGATNGTIFGAEANNGTGPAFTRFMESPDFKPVYYATLQRLLNTTFSKTEFDTTIDQTLGGFVPASEINKMKTWMDGRRAYVQTLIAPSVPPATNPPVAVISGEPRSPTPLRNATLTVGGASVTQYRFSLNGGAFGATNNVATSIVLTNLPNGGANTVTVITASTNGLWQNPTSGTVSKTWMVNTNWPAVRINEVLAKNVAALNHNGTFPDCIELYNEGSATVDLNNFRLTDTATSPGKYKFPSGTTLAPGAYLVVYANDPDGTPGIHTGFALKEDGEGVFLFDKTAGNGGTGALLDSVEFGLQLPDLSLGRINGGGEFVLTQPTFGSSNIAQPLADPHKLKINEWLASENVVSATDYIELYNTDPQPVALGGLYMTDNPIGEPAKSAIAPLSFIGGNGYRVFKADGDPQQGYDHLNFKLAAEQGIIALLAHDLQMLDIVLYGPQTTDVSQGRAPDGGNRIVFFDAATPGAANPGATACTVTATNLTLMALTNVWKYNQSNNLDAVNWTATNYNDSTWQSGPGLLAGGENNSLITPLINTTMLAPTAPPPGLSAGHAYYFRTTFVLSNNLAGYTINASAYVDDGAVIYVNGAEIPARIRMNAGAVNNLTLANATPSGGDATSPDAFTIPLSLFIAGTNVIAVEVHQQATTSSDIVWGMALAASLAITNCSQSTVVLNEVFASNQSFTNASGRAPDWVELCNTTTNPIDLGDMSLTDDTQTPRKWIFPGGSSIAPGEHLVIEFDDGLPSSPANTGFVLSASGGAVFLFQRPADGGSVLDSVHFGLQPGDFSIGRIADGSGSWALTLPTRATANVPAGLGNASSLKINEWLANSPVGDDWLELYNPVSQPVELSGFALSGNPSVHDQSPFPPLSFIGPDGYLKLVADGNTGNGADHVGFNLSAGGGFLGLFWPIGTQIDALSFGAQAADVSQGRFTDGTATIASFPGTASPGAPNYLLLTNVVINELLSHADPPLEDAVEIRNISSNPVDVGGWYLSNTGDKPRKFLVPSNTVINAGGFMVFYENQFGTNTSPAALVPFNFNSAHGGEVHFSQADAGGHLTGYRAHEIFGAAANGVSFGRYLTSVGGEFVAMSRRSFGVDNPATLAEFRAGAGATNPYPLVGPVVFSEINYHPTNRYLGDTSAAEFLELANVTSNSVPLFDPAAPANTWRISGGVDFVFPANVTLPAGATLLLVGFDPDTDPAQSNWFCGAYQVTNTPLFGPWSGALANEGEDLQLLKPDPPQMPPHPDAGFVPYVLVEYVHYLPTAPWATNGISAGASLQRTAPGNFGNEPLNWFAAAPTAALSSTTDSDGDGLPDWWEIAHGLNPNSSGGANGANGDPDGDGQGNLQEFIAGTDPRDGNDYLRIGFAGVNRILAMLEFNAVGGRTYSVLYSDDSPAGPWHKLADAPASANSAHAIISDNNPAAGKRFYRLATPSQP
jgi:hypothetical protein